MKTVIASTLITSALQAAIGKWNDQTTLEARGRYGAEVGRIQKAHAHQCDVIKQKHAAVCQQVTIPSVFCHIATSSIHSPMASQYSLFSPCTCAAVCHVTAFATFPNVQPPDMSHACLCPGFGLAGAHLCSQFSTA